MQQIREGVVLRFGSRGFGFLVEPSTRIEYYFHISNVRDWRVLQTGDRVRFRRDMRSPRPVAIQIELIESPDRLDREQAPTPSDPASSHRAASQQPSAAQPTSTEGGNR
jgi:cold shock CspA family protein